MRTLNLRPASILRFSGLRESLNGPAAILKRDPLRVDSLQRVSSPIACKCPPRAAAGARNAIRLSRSLIPNVNNGGTWTSVSSVAAAAVSGLLLISEVVVGREMHCGEPRPTGVLRATQAHAQGHRHPHHPIYIRHRRRRVNNTQRALDNCKCGWRRRVADFWHQQQDTKIIQVSENIKM